MVEITALGNAVNVDAWLASHEAAGELVIIDSLVRKACLGTTGLVRRKLDLKGKSKPVEV